MNSVVNSGPANEAALARSGDSKSIDQFFSLVSRIYDALRLRSAVANSIDARAPEMAADLLRRTRRRRAAFDLYLREAPSAYTEDFALAVRAQQGSTDSVLEIRRRLEPVVLKRIYAYNLGWNEEELVDLVFDRLTLKLPTYRGQASLRTWAGTLASNALKNWIRSEDAKPRMVTIDEAGSDTLIQHDEPDAFLLGDERDRSLKRLASELSRIAQEVLSPPEWELLQRLIIDEHTYDDLSDELGKTRVALRQRRFQALRKLKAGALARFGDDFSQVVLESLENE